MRLWPQTSSEGLPARAFRFARALGVGGVATAVDAAVLTFQIRVLGVDPGFARLPALCCGAITQFIGNRHFTFRAGAGRLDRQALLFVIFEAATLAMNFGLYQLLLRWLQPFLAPELISFIGTFAVFISFNYPMRKNVIFRLPASGPASRTANGAEA